MEVHMNEGALGFRSLRLLVAHRSARFLLCLLCLVACPSLTRRALPRIWSVWTVFGLMVQVLKSFDLHGGDQTTTRLAGPSLCACAWLHISHPSAVARPQADESRVALRYAARDSSRVW